MSKLLTDTSLASQNLLCYRADRSSVTFSGAFKAAQKYGVTMNTTIYAVFFSGLQKVCLATLSMGIFLTDAIAPSQGSNHSW